MSALAEAIRRIVPCERCAFCAWEPARRYLAIGYRYTPLCAEHAGAWERTATVMRTANAPEDLEAWDYATPEEREAALVEAFG
jgi:hypothetical protein